MASIVLHVQCIYIIRAECIGGTKPKNGLTPWVVHRIETMAALYLYGRTICASVSFSKDAVEAWKQMIFEEVFKTLCVIYYDICVDIETRKWPGV